MRTDGIYVWPDFLAGYVEPEDVELPEQFERHMADRGWRLPADLDTKSLVPPWLRPSSAGDQQPPPADEICYECDGEQLCWSCGGEGKRTSGERCHQCARSGK